MANQMFRYTSDILFDSESVQQGNICNVHLKQFSETCNFVQYLKPLTPEKPYFFAQIRALSARSRIVVGIAGPDISPEARPGHWISSVGYHNDTGKCYTSHLFVANTEGEKINVGDVFGVLVSYFGEKKSTVIFLKNGLPVATRFLFEPDKSKYLPTISLENGPIDLGFMWPDSAIAVPKYSMTNMLHWIKPKSVHYDVSKNLFEYKGQHDIHGELLIQSPHPLSTDISHFEVIVQEAMANSSGPTTCLASCSPLIPSPSAELCQDYIRFDFEKKAEDDTSLVGQRVGWGVHFDPAKRNSKTFNPKAEQLVYCYVSNDLQITCGKMLVQPEGGFYPAVMLRKGATKVEIDVDSNPRPIGLISRLDELFEKEKSSALRLLQEDILQREIKESMFRKSREVTVALAPDVCSLMLSSNTPGIHVTQLLKPLSPAHGYFSIRLIKFHEDSCIGVGVAGRLFPLNKYPGKVKSSTGWVSKDGKIYRNERSDGNLKGERFAEGDIIGMEIEAFAKEMSVALFTKNWRPIGTAYYTQPDKEEFIPTIALCGNGHDLIVEVFWQNMVRGPPIFSVVNLNDWCLPPGAVVDSETNTIYVEDHNIPLSIQAPYSLHKGYNHFEVRLSKPFGPDHPPPAIVLSTATPLDPAPNSCLKLDFLRFWPVNEAGQLVKVGDLVGWGLLYIEESLHHDEEQLVICYLTVNRKILLVRVVFQPPGGFYPLVVLPQYLNEVTLEFTATIINEHPITKKDVDILVEETYDLLKKEKEILARGGDPMAELGGAALFRNLPSVQAREISGTHTGSFEQNETVRDKRIAKYAKISKMSTSISNDPVTLKTRSTNSRKIRKTNQKSSRSCAIL